MAYAVQHPEQIARIILLNTAAFHLPKQKKFPWLLSLARSSLGKYFVLQHNAFARERHGLVVKKHAYPNSYAMPIVSL